MAGGMLEPLGRKNIQKLIDGLQKALAEATPLTAGEVATQMQGLDTPVPEALQAESARPQEAEVLSGRRAGSQPDKLCSPTE